MTDREAIFHALAAVRRRWRLRLLLEGLCQLAIAVVGAAILFTLVLRIGAGPDTAAAARAVFWIAAVAGLAAVLWRAFRRRVPDDVLALYLEEHEPTLRQSVVSAVHAARQTKAEAPALVERLLRSARSALAGVDDGQRVDARRLRRASGALTLFSAGGLVLLLLGPPSLREALRLLVDPTVSLPAPPVYSVTVEPGHATVPRGGAQEIRARLGGFTSSTADLVFRADSTSEWQRLPMEQDSAGTGFVSRMFDVTRPTEYLVESEGIRSEVFRIDVVDLPTVSGLSARIQYPAYTRLASETIDPAGDVAALRGSRVTMRAVVSRPARAAFLVVDGKRLPMEADGAEFTAGFRIEADGFYRVELETEDGRRIAGTLDFAIDALEDAPPTVRFSAPGRDTKVTSVEEVTAQIEAADDFGVRAITLHLSVNGGEEQVIAIMDSTVASRLEASAVHTMFLEEWDLEPGDVVSYFARARDGAGQEASSDLYFLEVRPFDRRYREAEQSGMPGGGGESAEGLTERQRQIVVGTFNVLRDSAQQSPRAWRENVTTLAIAEGRLREEVDGLVTRMRQRRLTAADTLFAQVAAELDSALVALGRAEEQLGRQRPRTALPDGQRALQHLQRAEAAYRDVQVQRGGQQGGGGSQSSAEELADLFELENDKLRNQYESVEREARAQTERQVDETLEKLRRLASRQQQENERMQRMADATQGRSGGGGGGAAQRELAREAEEAARQLERLSRERNDAALGETARRLREAAESMRRAASAGSSQGAAQGQQAMEQLRNATRELERSRSEGRREALQRLANRANELGRRQRELAEQTAGLPADPASRAQRAAGLAERKDALARDVEQLENDIGSAARDAGRAQPESARKLAEAAEGLREQRVRDKILFSKTLLRGGSPEYIRNFEDTITENLDQAAERLRAAAGAFGDSPESRETQALGRARELVRGLESLRDRAEAAQNRRDRDQADGSQAGGENGREQTGDSAAGRSGSARGQQPGDSRRESGSPDANGQARGQQRGDNAGSQSEQGQAGANRSPSDAAGGQSRGSPSGGGGGRLDPGEARQFARELGLRRRAADSLRADLERLGEDVSALDRLRERFRALDDPATFGDYRGLARLQDELIEGLKNLEFALWRKYSATSGREPATGASARVPPQYRELVEEYYRSLARGKPAPR